MRQIETFLLQRHYDGFLRKGRIRGRSATGRETTLATAGELKNAGALYSVLGGIFLVGILAWALKRWS
jgi:preprotein translocase subunit SecY